MLRNYFKIAIRNLIKNKTFSLVNILGLTLGFTCFILVSLFVIDELSFDSFHDDAREIYRVVQHITEPSGDSRDVAPVAPLIGPEANSRFPEITDQTQILPIGRLTVGNEPLTRDYESIWIANPNFFEFFNFEFLYGDPTQALVGPNNLVITESIALKYFGRKDVLGESLYTNRFEATITGVIKDFPKNSHIDMKTIHTRATWDPLFGLSDFYSTNWTANSVLTYLKTGPNFNKKNFEQELNSLVTGNYSDEIEYTSEFRLQPLTDIHLYSGSIEGGLNARKGSPLYLYMFSIVGVLILIIACFNYMNLSTAAASRRTREVGMRKTLGAGKGQLITQYLGESVILSVLSLALALTSVELLLPYINDLADRSLTLPFDSLTLVLSLIGVALLSGILSSLYPAFFLSRVNPAAAFKSEIQIGKSTFSLRKVLVVAQFAISIGMIASTLIIYKQLNYMKNKELGFDYNNRLVIDINSGAFRSQFQSIKQEFLKLPEVQHVSVSNRVPGEWKVQPVANVDRTDSDVSTQMMFIAADEDFLDTYDIKLLEGRNLRTELADSNSVLITKSGAEKLNLENPLGQVLSIPSTIWNGDFDEQNTPYSPVIVGIIDDFDIQSLHQTQKPVMIASWRNPIHNIDYYTLDIVTSDWQETIAKLKEVGFQFDPENPIEYTFLDGRFDALYKADQMRGKIFLIFSGIVIFIACMGLFALASFSIETRIREIGVRKVLGASSQNIILLVCKDFLMLVLIALFVSAPIAWYVVEQWLTDFAYRISINPLWFILAGLIALFISMLTISYQAFRAAMLNPVESLRSE